MSFGEKILDYKDQIITDLGELIAIKSITHEREKCEEALNWMLSKADSFGLTTKNVNNVAGHIELGEGGKLCGVRFGDGPWFYRM